MRILYAVNGTGNGHLARAREVIPHLLPYGKLDVIVSGTNGEVTLPITPRRYHGLAFFFGVSGGFDVKRTIQQFRPLHLLRDIREFPIKEYDIVINDFEIITAWAAKHANIPCVAFGHQAAFRSSHTPRTGHGRHWAELVLTYYAPTTRGIGLHFQPYDDFIYTPIIRDKMRHTTPTNQGHYTIYLPAYHERAFIPFLKMHPDKSWHVFSKHSRLPYVDGNVKVQPIDATAFEDSLIACEGLITGGGFESPAEALHLRKKLLSIPQRGQYEQACNAEALRRMGVPVIKKIDRDFGQHLARFIADDTRVIVNYPNQTADLVKKAIEMGLT